MAEINLQRKRKNLWWLWLLILLIVLAVIYYLYTNNYFDQDDLNAIHTLPCSFFNLEGIASIS